MKPKTKKPGRRSGPQPHGGNRKKVNDAHEAERIRRMEQQLASFHGASGGGGNGGGGNGDGDDGDEDGEWETKRKGHRRGMSLTTLPVILLCSF